MSNEVVDKTELLPCPWCGRVPQCYRIFENEPEAYIVECRNELCLRRKTMDEDVATVTAAWNTRVSTSADYIRGLEDAARLVDEGARLIRSLAEFPHKHAIAAGEEVLAKEIRALLPFIPISQPAEPHETAKAIVDGCIINYGSLVAGARAWLLKWITASLVERDAEIESHERMWEMNSRINETLRQRIAELSPSLERAVNTPKDVDAEILE